MRRRPRRKHTTHALALCVGLALLISLLIAGCDQSEKRRRRFVQVNHDVPQRVERMERALVAGDAVEIGDFSLRHQEGVLVLSEDEEMGTSTVVAMIFLMLLLGGISIGVGVQESPVLGIGSFVLLSSIFCCLGYKETKRTRATFDLASSRVTIVETHLGGWSRKTHHVNLRDEGEFLSRCYYDSGDDEDPPTENCKLFIRWRKGSEREHYRIWYESASPGPKGNRLRGESRALCLVFARVTNNTCQCLYAGRRVDGYTPGAKSPVVFSAQAGAAPDMSRAVDMTSRERDMGRLDMRGSAHSGGEMGVSLSSEAADMGSLRDGGMTDGR